MFGRVFERVKWFLRFYRVRDWFHLLGLSFIGLVLALPSYNIFLSVICLLQVCLVHMNSFSMNDYYDHVFWGEETVSGLFVDDMGAGLGYIMFLLPLVFCIAFFPFTGFYTFFLLVYPALAYFYHGPLQLKDSLFFSIFINSISSVFVFLYPFLVVGDSMVIGAVFFSLLFVLYTAIFEVGHQIEHFGEEDSVSIVDFCGVEGCVNVLRYLVVTCVFLSLFFAVFFSYYVALVGLSFGIIRLKKLSDLEVSLDSLIYVRRSYHKFYSVPEGLITCVFLVLPTLI